MLRHSYSLQKLRESNFRIYNGGVEILKSPQDFRIYPRIPPYTPSITIGQKLVTDDEAIDQITYPDLNAMGFMITSRYNPGKFRARQTTEYFITYLNFIGNVGRVPQEHTVEYDKVSKRLRLLGPNSDGRWVRTSRVKKVKEWKNRKFNPAHMDHFNNLYSTLMNDMMPGSEEAYAENVPIKEIPVIISEDGKLVCLPVTRDTNCVGAFGQRGSGKSVLLHGLGDRLYARGKKVMFFNDITNETLTYNQAWTDDNPFAESLRLSGESTRPLPTVYLAVNTNTVQTLLDGEAGIVEREGVLQRISMPFRQCMLNYELFFSGVAGWDMQKCGKYFRKILYDDEGNITGERFLNSTSLSDIKKAVDTLQFRGASMKAIVGDFTETVLTDLYTSRMFDVSCKIPSKWTVQYPNGSLREYYPWIALMAAGLVPVLLNSDLLDKNYYCAPLNFILRDIFDVQRNDEMFFRNEIEIFLITDEVGTMFEKSAEFTADFSKFVARGRPHRTAAVIAEQFINKVPKDILINISHNFFFRQRGDQVEQISRDFPMLKFQEKYFTKLKKLECVALASNSYFITYDKNGNREEVYDTPIKGKVLPPLSYHKPPSSKGE